MGSRMADLGVAKALRNGGSWRSNSSRNLSNRETLFAEAPQLHQIHEAHRPPDLFSLGPGSGHACTHALDQDLALELREHGCEGEEGSPEGCVRIEGLLHCDEPHPHLLKLLEELKSVQRAPGHAREIPDHHGLESAMPCVLDEAVQGGPASLG